MTKTNDAANVVTLPNLQVQLPIVKLTLEDLAYLRTLATGKQGCRFDSQKSISKLTFCGLITEELLEPAKEKVLEFTKDKKRRIALSISSVREHKWEIAIEHIRWMRDTEKGLKPEKGMVLTSAGHQLLKQGSAIGKMAQTGCPS